MIRAKSLVWDVPDHESENDDLAGDSKPDRHVESVLRFKSLDNVLESLEAFRDPKLVPLRNDPPEQASTTDDESDPANQLPAEVIPRLVEDFPKLKAYYLDAREKLHGGVARMVATDVFFPSERQFADAENYVGGVFRRWLPSLTGQVTAIGAQVGIGLAIMVLGMFYFLKDGPGMIRAVMRLSPLDDRYEQELLSKFDSVSRAVVLATLLSAIAQGLLAGIGYYVAGVQSVFLLTMLTTVMAMVPVVGAGSVWIPTCLWLAVVDNRIMAAVILACYGAGVVSMIDNIIKPFVLHGQSNLHPLLALLSVLGGVKALGPIGIIVGPMSVSFLQALLNMLHTELQEMDRSASSAESTAATATAATAATETRNPDMSAAS
jgi:predicted PurR-regulated permease PerM